MSMPSRVFLPTSALPRLQPITVLYCVRRTTPTVTLPHWRGGEIDYNTFEELTWREVVYVTNMEKASLRDGQRHNLNASGRPDGILFESHAEAYQEKLEFPQAHHHVPYHTHVLYQLLHLLRAVWERPVYNTIRRIATTCRTDLLRLEGHTYKKIPTTPIYRHCGCFFCLFEFLRKVISMNIEIIDKCKSLHN